MPLPALIAVNDPNGTGVTNVLVNVTCKGFMYMGCTGSNSGSLRFASVTPDSPATIFDTAASVIPAVDGMKLGKVGDYFKLCSASSSWYFSIEANNIGDTTYYFMPITDTTFDSALAATPGITTTY